MNDMIAAPFIMDDEPFDTTTDGTITYHHKLVQGSAEWLQARLGLLTASEMKLALTPTLKPARNDKIRTHVYELAAQRITNHIEPGYISDDMLRGQIDETFARDIYSRNIAPIRQMGFITNNKWGVTIGYSPDGMVGDDGLWECKSRAAKYQVQTIAQAARSVTSLEIPVEFSLQCQTGLLVAERDWLDFTSYSGGLPMVTMRVFPDDAVQAAIIEAAQTIEEQVKEAMTEYADTLPALQAFPTERRNYEDFIA